MPYINPKPGTVVPEVRYGPGSSAGHFYDPGPPCRLVEAVRKVNGDWRNPHLGDARKHGWCKGVTSITGIPVAHQLEKWKRKQAVMAARTMPDLPDDEEEAFKRIEEDARQQVTDAATIGTAIHAALARYIERGVITDGYEAVIRRAASLLYELTGHHVEDAGWSAEQCLAHPYGYASSIDLVSHECGVIIDWKGKSGVTPGTKGYDRELQQLVAYEKMAQQEHPQTYRLINVFVDRDLSGNMVAYEWDDYTARRRAWREFVWLLGYWQIHNRMPLRVPLEAVK